MGEPAGAVWRVSRAGRPARVALDSRTRTSATEAPESCEEQGSEALTG